MKKFTHIALIFLCVISLKLVSQPKSDSRNGFSSINKDEMFINLKFLASDSLKGRETGTKENEVAARFIAEKFKEYGLIPLGNQSNKSLMNKNQDKYKISIEDYFQKFNIIKSKLSNKNVLRLHLEGQKSRKSFSFNYKDDFIVQAKSLFNNVNIKAPVVFAGYGIDGGEKKYSDYLTEDGKKIDVKNKVVLIVDGYPQENNSESEFSRSRNASYRNPLRKMEIAQKLGALAIVIVSSPLKNDSPFNIKFQTRSIAFEKSNFFLPIQTSEAIPIIYLSENVAHLIFKSTGKSLKEILQKIENKLAGQAFEFQDLSIEIEINFEEELITTQNVVGLIEGSDERHKDEFIIVGAHYDHVGFGYYGAMKHSEEGKIHNGADDNASGTSALIELAEAFSISKPARSLIFIAFSAEENGLLGSKFYVFHQPLHSLEKTIAMFNFDMIGRNEKNLLWIGGAFYSDNLKKFIELANKETKFDLLYNIGLLNFASDQAPFLRKNIPSAFFFTGLHDDYHTPEDDYDKIDYDKLERVTKLGFLSINKLANIDDRPIYRELTIEERKILVEQSLQILKKYRTTIKPEGVSEEQ